jgi:hypothetical protein
MRLFRTVTGMKMIKLINRVVTKIKKEPYELDDQIPTRYLIVLLFERMCMIVRGMFMLSNMTCFVGPGVKIKCKAKFKFGNGLTLAAYSYIDALSEEGVVIGENFSLGKYGSIECTGNLKKIGKGFYAGNNVGAGSHTFFGSAGGISIGDDTIIGNFASFHSDERQL